MSPALSVELPVPHGPPDLTMAQSTQGPAKRRPKAWLYPFHTGRLRVYCTHTTQLSQSAHPVTFPLPHGAQPPSSDCTHFHTVRPEVILHTVAPYHIYHLPILVIISGMLNMEHIHICTGTLIFSIWNSMVMFILWIGQPYLIIISGNA